MRKRLTVLHLIPPLYTLVTIWPMISELPPLVKPDNFNAFQVLIVLPFYLGLLACPGYLFAWYGYYDQQLLTHYGRMFVGISLSLALLASLGGLISILAVIPFPGVIGSLVSCTMILTKFYGSRSRKLVEMQDSSQSANQAL